MVIGGPFDAGRNKIENGVSGITKTVNNCAYSLVSSRRPNLSEKSHPPASVAAHRRLSHLPVALLAASSLALDPLAIPNTTPTSLAAAVLSQSRQAAESLGSGVAHAASEVAPAVSASNPSAVALLAAAPTLLQTVGTHELAQFVALPAATSPQQTTANSRAADESGLRTAAVAAVAADDPAADLLAALQSAFGKIQDAFVGAPGNVFTSQQQFLSGDVRTSLQTFTNILIEPLVLIALIDLPNIATPLTKLAPFFAPVIDALPNIAINIGVGAVQLIVDVREGMADAYEGVRDGLTKGDSTPPCRASSPGLRRSPRRASPTCSVSSASCTA